jgi:hypothetical protein
MYCFSYINLKITNRNVVKALLYQDKLQIIFSPSAMLAVAYAADRASHARPVTGDDPDKKGYPGPPGWGFGVGLTTPHSKILLL